MVLIDSCYEAVHQLELVRKNPHDDQNNIPPCLCRRVSHMDLIRSMPQSRNIISLLQKVIVFMTSSGSRRKWLKKSAAGALGH